MRLLTEHLEQASSRLGAMGSEEALALFDELVVALRSALAAPNADAHRLFASAKKLLHGLSHEVLSTARVEGLLLSAQFAYISGRPFAGLEHSSLAVSCARSSRTRSGV